jgi:hypothetical protein
MEIINRIVPLEDLISRKSPLNLDGKTISMGGNNCVVIQTKDIILENAIDISFNWGEIIAESFSINIFLTQNIDDIGIYKDIESVDEIPDYSILENYYNSITGLTWTTPLPHNMVFTGPYTIDQTLLYRLRGQTASDHYFSGGTVTGLTSSLIDTVKTYKIVTPYQVGSNLNTDPTQYFTGILSLTTGSTNYVLDASITDLFNSGIRYVDDNTKRTVYDSTFNIDIIINKTTFEYSAPGWNSSNTSLSALTKEELDLGIVFPHKIYNDVFIDRSEISVEETQMKLSEIDTLAQLIRYGNKFYNIKTQY